MLPETSTLVSADATRELLLLHTAIDGMGIAVSVILLRALFALRRDREALPGMLTMVSFMLVTELLRSVWLAFLWISAPAPLSLDLLSFATGFVVLVGLPIIGSARYLPKTGASNVVPRPWVWLQRAMVLTALVGFAVLLVAMGLRVRAAVFLGPAAAYTLTAAFLVSRFSFYRHLQVRRRPQLLFVVFVAAGLLLLAFVAAFSVLTQVRIRQSLPLASLNGVGLISVLCGTVFLFAHVRQADVIVKRTMRVILGTCVSLLAWFVLMHSGGTALGLEGGGQDVICLMFLFGGLALAPPAERRLNLWVDQWVFQQPEMQRAVASLWSRLLATEERTDAFLLTETFLRDAIFGAAVRIEPTERESPSSDFDAFPTGPGSGPPSKKLEDRRDEAPGVFFPLFVDGRAEYAIALRQGSARPALTQWEMDTAERAAGRLQVWLGTRSAADRTRREALLQQELASAELRALRAQVNPHFLFNSLNTIADLAVIAPAQAEEMTVRLASVFRYVLVNTDRHFSSLKEELDFSRSYLSIEQTRFGDRLRVVFEVDPLSLDQQIPTLLLQPLIENALKHGIAPRREGGTLTIRTHSDHDGITVSVADDGVGLNERATASERSTHVGINNVHNRLQTAYGGRASFRLRRREQGGTEALVRIPRSKDDDESSAGG